jgi:hypothetical protein
VVEVAKKLCLADHSHLLVSRPANSTDVADRLARPGLSHSLIGLLTTVVSVLTTQDRHFSVTAKITLTIITVWGGSMLTLAVIYDRILEKIMTPHDKEIVANGEP